MGKFGAAKRSKGQLIDTECILLQTNDWWEESQDNGTDQGTTLDSTQFRTIY